MNATSASAGVPVESSWEELVSVALLGTERRTPPAWAAGREVPVAATPLGRLAHAADVAQAVTFYAAEDNAF
ncbi:hypothetical protein ABZ460_41140, partial [Streptomyces fagopyri]